MKDEKYLDEIIRFLNEISIQVIQENLDGNCVLPGLEVKGNTILFDRKRIKYVGDILHEAGHIAVTPKELRALIGTEEMDTNWPTEGDEIASILWSYAALTHLNIPPEVVFHPEGYKNESQWLIEQFESGNFIGLPLLNYMGFLGEPGRIPSEFPAMVKWLR